MKAVHATGDGPETKPPKLVTVGIYNIAYGITHLPIAMHKAVCTFKGFHFDRKNLFAFYLCRHQKCACRSPIAEFDISIFEPVRE